MRIVMFYHSLVSDWNHGNAHFLRGVATELVLGGHDVRICEPVNAWSRVKLEEEHGARPLRQFRRFYPHLRTHFYHPDLIELDEVLGTADLVLVHEWNDHGLVRRIGRHHARHDSYTLLFHDTHHRSVTDAASMGAYDLSGYDGVLAFGKVIRDLYLARGWAQRGWTWHEAADARVFQPVAGARARGDLVWIGNWGDDERTAELRDFLIEPARELGLKAAVYGVRYPKEARAMLAEAGIEYRGWLPNYLVPKVFSEFRFTVHVPRRPYVASLPGIPTIRVFEALACGIPLISAPWTDTERLFRAGSDFLTVQDGRQMRRAMKRLKEDRRLARALSRSGRDTILQRHTCEHRVAELLEIHREVQSGKLARKRLGIAG